jgi:hypothetical protein
MNYINRVNPLITAIQTCCDCEIYNKNQKSPGKSVKFRRKEKFRICFVHDSYTDLKIHDRAALPVMDLAMVV